MMQETLIPKIGVVTDIRIDTPDIKTFRVVGLDGKKVFDHMPGQCAMLSIPGVGEAMFSITSSPTNTEYMEFSIKKCGCLTSWLHAMDVGQQITIRGPYGRHFPVEDELKGKDLLFVAGGVGLAPLRSVINYVRAKRENYGKIMIVYGSRSKDDLLDYHEILDEWMKDEGVDVELTIDRPQEGWDGHVGFVPTYLKEIGFDTIERREAELTQYAVKRLLAIPGVHILGSQDPSEHHSIVTFLVDNVHPHDVASILDMDHIAVRAGHHCAQPLLQHLNVSATTRASFAFYNTMEEVDALADSLAQVRRRMGYVD